MIDRTDNVQKQTISTHHPRTVDYSYRRRQWCLHYWYYYCLLVWGERVNGWCVEVVRRVDGTSDQARSRRGPMLISEVMSQWRWSIGVVRPNDGGSLWCTIFYSAWFGTERKLKKKVVARCKQATNHETEGLPLLYIVWRWVMFLHGVVIYCMLAMGPGQLYALFFR